MQATETEREALARLPELLGDLLDERGIRVEASAQPLPSGPNIDLFATDTSGRVWLAEVKASSGPGHIKAVAKQLAEIPREEGIAVLVVPHMSPAGARTAEEEGLNWIDFAGNASINEEGLKVLVRGRDRVHRPRGRPASPFAPRSARVTRQLLLHPKRWWRQRDLAQVTKLNDGTVSRVVHRLNEELLLELQGNMVRAREPRLLLDAWQGDYRFDKHDIVDCHASGSGIELARELGARLQALNVRHAFTGLPAAWAIDHFAKFRLITIYTEGDPRAIADALRMRRSQRGANVQLVGPNDMGVFDGEQVHDALRCVSMVQVYLDLQHLPERADDAAEHLRSQHLSWESD